MSNAPTVHACRFCGETDPAHLSAKVDYCRGCYYDGRTMEEAFADFLTDIAGHTNLDAHVAHTGGGCFVISLVLADGSYVWASGAESGTLPEADNADERWLLGYYIGETLGGEDWDGDALEYADGLTRDEAIAFFARHALAHGAPSDPIQSAVGYITDLTSGLSDAEAVEVLRSIASFATDVADEIGGAS
jgi:hypothetical protein